MVEYDKIAGSDDIVKEIEEVRGDVSFAEWKRLVSNAFNSGDLTAEEKIGLFGLPIEAFCTDEDAVDVAGTVSVDAVPAKDIMAEVEHIIDRYDKSMSGKMVGVHVTEMGRANEILDSGIEGSRYNGPDEHTERQNAFFCWIHSTDVDATMHNHPDGIVVVCPINKVRVSSFMNVDLLRGGYCDPDEYDQHHTINYSSYINELIKGNHRSMQHTTDTLFPFERI